MRELATLPNAPRVVVVSISDEDSELIIEALQLGAFAAVRKPTALANDRLYELSNELPARVLAAAGAVPALSSVQLVVIGTSTGGPQALSHLLAALPANFPAPIAIALHIPAEYTLALARRLDLLCQLKVVEATDGLRLRAGEIALAPGGIHLAIEPGRIARLTSVPVDAPYFPSVNVLFKSAAGRQRWPPSASLP